jgi:peptidoglycan/xylan/chitin deacetylase (PgdA/CDA1 family)
VSPEALAPVIGPLDGPFGYALTVDVEEWYHTCLVHDFVEPTRRPPLPRELDRLLPWMLELLAEHDCRATFFTLGEVASELPGRIREIAAAGHEVASHGLHHLRVNGMSPRRFRGEIERAKKQLEDLLGEGVDGYRAPEWSMREPGNPRLAILAELGFRYDSSLAACLGSGRRDNPRRASYLRWTADDGVRELFELPPLTFGGRWQLPAGGWPGRIAGVEVVERAARRHRAAGGLPVIVVHPWELANRPVPGELTGVARWVHEFGRHKLREEMPGLLAAIEWRTVREALGVTTDLPPATTAPEPSRERAEATTLT